MSSHAITQQAPAFNLLRYRKRLKKAGFSEEQAEVQAEGLRELIETNIATKQDLQYGLDNLELKLKAEIRNSTNNSVIKISGVIILINLIVPVSHFLTHLLH